jgi:hypothetical protein
MVLVIEKQIYLSLSLDLCIWVREKKRGRRLLLSWVKLA